MTVNVYLRSAMGLLCCREKGCEMENIFGIEAALGHLFVFCLNSLLALFLNHHHHHRSPTAE